MYSVTPVSTRYHASSIGYYDMRYREPLPTISVTASFRLQVVIMHLWFEAVEREKVVSLPVIIV
jgi:hypothetical protein